MLIPTPDHPRLSMQACGMSEAGAVRARNEDCFVVDAAPGLAAVADGMGGHMAGEVASSGALAALVRSLADSAVASYAGGAAGDPDATELDLRWDTTLRLRRAVDQANALLYEENRARGHADGDGMGSTLTGLQFLPALDAIVSFHVGDSRLYRWRDGMLVQLTRAQTAYQLALESSAPGDLPPRNLLLQAIGPAPAVTPDLACHDVCAGDLLLLCSDRCCWRVSRADSRRSKKCRPIRVQSIWACVSLPEPTNERQHAVGPGRPESGQDQRAHVPRTGQRGAFRRIVKREAMPGTLGDDELERYLRNGAVTYRHQSCTAKMGRDEMSVVNAQLEVYGVPNLRIADASIMPRITTGNTMAPCVVIGERAAEMIKAAYGI